MFFCVFLCTPVLLLSHSLPQGMDNSEKRREQSNWLLAFESQNPGNKFGNIADESDQSFLSHCTPTRLSFLRIEEKGVYEEKWAQEENMKELNEGLWDRRAWWRWGPREVPRSQRRNGFMVCALVENLDGFIETSFGSSSPSEKMERWPDAAESGPEVAQGFSTILSVSSMREPQLLCMFNTSTDTTRCLL